MSHNIRPGKTLTVYIPYGDIRKYDKNLFNQSGAICILRITPCTLYSSLTWLCTPHPNTFVRPHAPYQNPGCVSEPTLSIRPPCSVSDPHARYQTPMLRFQTPCSVSDPMLIIRPHARGLYQTCPHAQYQTPCLRSSCSEYRPPCSVSDPTHAPYQTIV